MKRCRRKSTVTYRCNTAVKRADSTRGLDLLKGMQVNRKQIAAITGVMYYLQEERRKLLDQMGIIPYSMINRWSMHGRQTIMKLRTRAQLRTLGSHMCLPFLNHMMLNNGRVPAPLHRIKNLAVAQNMLKTQAQIRKAQIQKMKMKSPGQYVSEGRV